MKENLDFGMQLSQDEKGQLHGGFELQQVSFDDNSHFDSDNGNCKSGGWFDDNTNCHRCSGCSGA